MIKNIFICLPKYNVYYRNTSKTAKERHYAMTSFEVARDTVMDTTYTDGNGATRWIKKPVQQIQDLIRCQGYQYLMEKRPKF